MVAILFFKFWEWGTWSGYSPHLLLGNLSKLRMKKFLRQHAVTLKTILFNLLIFLMLTSLGNYAYIFSHFQVS